MGGSGPNRLDAQLVFQNSNGLPEDRYVMTSHWGTTNTVTDTHRDAVAAMLEQFINDPITSGAPALVEFLSGELSNTAQIRLYTAGDPEPRVPALYEFTLGTRSGSATMPHEVALCLSYYAGQNVPRKRGRMYFGPLAGGSTVATVSNGHVRPSSGLIDALANAGGRMIGTGGTNPQWVVLSSFIGASYTTDVWVDNAFDTQRRRGIAPDARVTRP